MIDPLDRYLGHLLRSKPDTAQTLEKRACALESNMARGIRALSDLNYAREIFIDSNLTYDQLYQKLISFFDKDTKTEQTLLVGIYQDPGSSIVSNFNTFEPVITNTRYKVHLCDYQAGDQAGTLMHESPAMLERLGIKPDFDFYLQSIVGRRIFSRDPNTGADRPMPILKMIELHSGAA